MLINADARRIPLADRSIHCAVCSPPYWGLRSYSIGTDDGELGLEQSPDEYVANQVAVGREVWRVLRDDGTWWIVISDSYWGGGRGGNTPKTSENWKPEYGHPDWKHAVLKPKDLVGIPARLALALQADGWYWRSAPPWLKKNPMPESCTDRPTTAHETVLLLSKSQRYFYDGDAVRIEHKAASIERTRHSWDGVRDRGYPGNAQTLDMSRGCHPAGRNRRTTDWWYESLDLLIAQERDYLAHLCDIRANGGMLCDEDGMPLGFMVNTQGYSGPHFATYPEALVRPMIKASTSERGCCPECGAPWVRVAKKELIPQYETRHGGFHARGTRDGMVDFSQNWTPGTNSVTTLGWRPTCACYDDRYRSEFPQARSPRKRHQRDVSGDWWERVCRRPGRDEWDTVPAIVLDPFVGSGTTGVVCERLQRRRRWVGLDLSWGYLQQARERTGAKALDEWEKGAPAQETDLTGLPLFGGEM